MRRNMIRGGAAVLVACGVIATRVDLRASDKIDVSGATLSPGDATTQGAVTIDPAASLGAVPPVTDVASDYGASDDDVNGYKDQVFTFADSGYTFGGLGGPNFVAHGNLTISPGEHNYGSFTVDAGVTVTVPAGTTVHIAGPARVDGRVVLDGQGNLAASLDCGGDLTVVGHAGSTIGGIVLGESATYYGTYYGGVQLPGRLVVTADAGERVALEGAIAVYGSRDATIEHVTSSHGLSLSLGGDVAMSDCVCPLIDVNSVKDAATSISSSSFPALNLSLGGAATLTDSTIRRLSVNAPTGSLHVTGNSSLGAAPSTATGADRGSVDITTLGDVVIDDDVAVSPLDTFSVSAYRGAIVLGRGVQVDLRGSPDNDGNTRYTALTPQSYAGVEIRGSLKADDWLSASADVGDVVLGAGAELVCTNGPVNLEAQGAVTAQGGTATITCGGNLDVRCVDGDLDLDVASVTSGGQIVALSNGEVRLRGSFSAARDVQVLSRKDAIDVSGATIRTADAGQYVSGFVRLATYASTATIDASDASLSTGASDGQSGDILLQVADTGGATTTGALRVAAVRTRDSVDGPITQIRGTIASRRGALNLAGSNRVAAGKAALHLFLRGLRGKVSGTARGVELKATRVTSRSSSFVLTLHDGGGVASETVRLELQRAGFLAVGKFKRPRK